MENTIPLIEQLGTKDDNQLHPTAASTLSAYGSSRGGLRYAHKGEITNVANGPFAVRDRVKRENDEAANFSALATLASGSGKRIIEEEADELRTCFERDLDRIKHSSEFRRLAGKAQVFVNPRNDLIRTRMTHSIEVAQVATAVARATGLNVALTEAIALGHDCGHGPGGHPAEEVFSNYLPNGFDHAVWGADVTLTNLNLCAETLDGIRNHSWKRPAPITAEGSVVSWADRIGYVCHDWSDAIRAGIVNPSELPALVSERASNQQSGQLRYFTNALIEGISSTGSVCMPESAAEVLDEFRGFNYEWIYLRVESQDQAKMVKKALTALCDHFVDNPHLISKNIDTPEPGSEAAGVAAVTYLAKMTDRHAFGLARNLLDFPKNQLPQIA